MSSWKPRAGGCAINCATTSPSEKTRPRRTARPSWSSRISCSPQATVFTRRIATEWWSFAASREPPPRALLQSTPRTWPRATPCSGGTTVRVISAIAPITRGIRLSQPLTAPFDGGRVSFSLAGSVADALPVVSFGYGGGGPVKVDTGRVRNPRADHDDYFMTNLDAFAGMSGAPIFDDRRTLLGISTAERPTTSGMKTRVATDRSTWPTTQGGRRRRMPSVHSRGSARRRPTARRACNSERRAVRHGARVAVWVPDPVGCVRRYGLRSPLRSRLADVVVVVAGRARRGASRALRPDAEP